MDNRTKHLIKQRQAASSTSKGKSSVPLQTIENVFFEKFTEKYRLTSRDVKRAFGRFDKNGKGKLTISDLADGIALFVQGFDRMQIIELARHYDVNGDGDISLDEFSNFLISRRTDNKDDWLSIDSLVSPSTGNTKISNASALGLNTVFNNMTVKAVAAFDVNDVEQPPYKSKIFLQNFRSILLKRAIEMKKAGTQFAPSERMTYSNDELAELLAHKTIVRAFQGFAKSDVGASEVGYLRVDYPSFSRVLKRIIPPGGLEPTDDVLNYLFQQCSRFDKNNSGSVDPDVLVDMMFEKNSTRINTFGFIQPTKAATETSRPLNGRGPFIVNASGNGAEGLRPIQSITDIPYRVNTRHCKTALAAPSCVSMNQVVRSASTPVMGCRKEFVYGLNATTLNSGNCVKVLSTCQSRGSNLPTILYVTAALGVVHNLHTNGQLYFDQHTDDITCFAVSDPFSWSSSLKGSSDYIEYGEKTNYLRQIAATGQRGRSPCVFLWETWPTTSSDSSGLKLIAKIGSGFFSRGVCAVAFSPDVNYLCAISCDDKHSLGIWKIQTGQLVVDSAGYAGVPPAITGIAWGSERMSNDSNFVCKEHQDGADIICTYGERHIKFWSFVRPTGTSNQGSLNNKLGRYGFESRVKTKTEVPLSLAKASAVVASARDENTTLRSPDYFLSACFLNGGNVVVAGGDNGYLYIFKEGQCARTLSVYPAVSTVNDVKKSRGISTVSSIGNIIYCGGSSGEVTMVDMNTFTIINSVNIHTSPDITTSAQPLASNPIQPLSTTGKVRAAGTASKAVKVVTRPGRFKPKDAWLDGPANVQTTSTLPDGLKACPSILGMSPVLRLNGSGETYESAWIVVAGNGKCFYVSLGNGRNSLDNIQTLFYFHYGGLYAVASKPTYSAVPDRKVITGGDDKFICVWSPADKLLLARTKCYAPIRCICIDSLSGNFVAIGTAGGGFGIYSIDNVRNADRGNVQAQKSSSIDRSTQGSKCTITLLCSKRDCKEDISDIKFSPNCKMLAVGSHDNFIDIYSVKFNVSGGTSSASSNGILCNFVKRLKGHSSFVTHLDWSYDNTLLRSTCGAYEILYWDVATGRQILSSTDNTEADTVWATDTCILGFDVMGVWGHGNESGDDINALDVDREKGIVVTSDDCGKVRVFNFPCIVKNAPSQVGVGHSSHVMGITLLREAVQDRAVTVGGYDGTVIQWSIERTDN